MSFHESVPLLRQLHRLIAEDRGDELEADAIRDQMDGPWDRMTDEERQLLDLLSADLYTLSEPQSPARAAPPDQRVAFEAALRDERWIDVLTLLHRERALAVAPRAAVLRSRAWQAFGEPEIAREFAVLADRLLADGPSPRRRAGPLVFPAFSSAETRRIDWRDAA